MAYKKPSAYARFVPTSNTISSVGSSRTMALVGTGKLFFDVLNETILRQSNTTSELLSRENVYEIYHVTSKPLKNGSVDMTDGGVEYINGVDFELREGKYISWKINPDKPATVLEPVPFGGSEGAQEFAKAVHASVNDKTLVKSGKYKIEVTYVDNSVPALGTYAIVDFNTEEVLGEYTVGTQPVDAIPGISLFVTDTFFPKVSDGATPVPVYDAEGNIESVVTPGDYVIVQTIAGGTVDSAAPTNNAYYVSYAYRKAEEDFLPKVFTTYDDVVDEYGDYEVTASGKVINSLALAAEIAFVNGVNPIVCVQAKNDSDYSIQKAIDHLERDVAGVNNFNTVVPLSTSKGVAAYTMGHINKMSDSDIGKERMAYISAPATETYAESAAAASSFNNERIVYVVPGEATKSVRDLTTGRTSVRRVSGCFLTVAVAALGLVNDPAEPLTNKTITGFEGLGRLYAETEKNIMASKGCLILEQNGSIIRVRHGMTTATATVNSNEITLVQIKDMVIDAARNNLGSSFVGRKLVPTIVSDVQIALVNILTQFVGQQVIISYGGVNVKRSKEDPRAIDVKFEIEAVYPLNYINIEFSFSGVN